MALRRSNNPRNNQRGNQNVYPSQGEQPKLERRVELLEQFTCRVVHLLANLDGIDLLKPLEKEEVRAKVTNQNWSSEYKKLSSALHFAIHPSNKNQRGDISEQLQQTQATMAQQQQTMAELQTQLIQSQTQNAQQQQKLIDEERNSF